MNDTNGKDTNGKDTNGKKQMIELERFYNVMSNFEDVEDFENAFNGVHRTLQTKMLKSFFNIIKNSANNYKTGYCDGRNINALKTCEMLIDLYEKEIDFKLDKGLVLASV